MSDEEYTKIKAENEVLSVKVSELETRANVAEFELKTYQKWARIFEDRDRRAEAVLRAALMIADLKTLQAVCVWVGGDLLKCKTKKTALAAIKAGEDARRSSGALHVWLAVANALGIEFEGPLPSIDQMREKLLTEIARLKGQYESQKVA